MSAPIESRDGAPAFSLERRLAPHVEAAWAGDLVLEMRLLGVAGSQIGAALSEVESHCADSGEGAPDAFGDAATYARSLDLPRSDDASLRATFWPFAPTGVQLAGMSFVNWSVEPMLDGRPLEITVGHLVGALTAIVGLALVVRFADPALRLLTRSPGIAGLVLGFWFVVVIGVGVAALLLLETPIWRVGAAWGLVGGAAVLIGGAGWALARSRANPGPDDQITSPLAPLPPAPTRLGRLIEGPALGTVIATAVIPIGTLGLVALSLLLDTLAT